MITPRLKELFSDYSSNHQTQGNRITHYFGITFIIVSLLGLLGNLVIGSNGLTGLFYFRLDAGVILLCIGLLWYLYLDWKIGAPFGLVLVGFYFLGRAIPNPINWGLFISGWILQFLGHSLFEKKSPAFFHNLLHLLIGPLWIFSKVIGYR